MNIKEDVERIQKLIDTLQWAINEADEEFKFYYLLISDMGANPMAVQLIRRNHIKDSEIAQTFKFDFFEIYVSTHLAEQFEEEEEYLKKNHAPAAQINELKHIRELFGM